MSKNIASIRKSSTSGNVGRPQGRSADETRQTILAAARRCFVAKGYGATKLKDIASGAGVTPAAIYTYFDSKPQVFAENFAETFGALLPDFEQIIASEANFRQKLRAMLMAMADLAESEPEIAAFLLSVPNEMSRNPEIAEFDKGYTDSVHETLVRLFQQGIDSGEAPSHLNADELMTTFIGGAFGMAIFEITTGTGSLRAGIEAILELLEAR